jgi:hypothetical protein
LTLTDTKSWEDVNDVFAINKFKELSGASSFHAICFLGASETYHHWKIYSGKRGACIEFDRHELTRIFKRTSGCALRKVKYLSNEKLKTRIQCANFDIREIPFIKRIPYRGEEEVRGIYYSEESRSSSTFQVSFPSTCIKKITLSPWLLDDDFEIMRSTIISLGYDREIINRSKLLDADFWKSTLDMIP